MTVTQIAQRAFGALLVLAAVTTIAVQGRSATSPISPAMLAEAQQPDGAQLRFKFSILIHAVPAGTEAAAARRCNIGPAGAMKVGCTRFAEIDSSADDEPESYRVELQMVDFTKGKSPS